MHVQQATEWAAGRCESSVGRPPCILLLFAGELVLLSVLSLSACELHAGMEFRTELEPS